MCAKEICFCFSTKCYLSDSPVYQRLKKELSNTRLMNGINQVSPVAQTSCLEGYHSVVNQFAPKMVAYSYKGIYCRTVLAAIHFNNNLRRGVKCKDDGSKRIKIFYPKFKNGEATIKDVRVNQNFGKLVNDNLHLI